MFNYEWNFMKTFSHKNNEPSDPQDKENNKV